MKRIISGYIIKEISLLFLLGITVFTLVLLMGRLIVLTELVVSRGVAFIDVCRMIVYLIPSFLVFTIPMAFLLAVLLAFGRLSADNEIIIFKSCGISLLQLAPPVFFCAFFAVSLSLVVSLSGVPWGNSSFKDFSISLLKKNITSSVREKIFWDDIPGIVMYVDQFDEQHRNLKGVLIHDGRDMARPMTIFARDGALVESAENHAAQLALHNGSIHLPDDNGLYRIVHFGEYSMMIAENGTSRETARDESELSLSELRQQLAAPGIQRARMLKLLVELHSRFTFPAASFVFSVVAIPFGLQTRRSGKSGGFAVSIGIILGYYVLMSVMRTVAERGVIPPIIALWLPNILFLLVGIYLLKRASLEKKFSQLIPVCLRKIVK